MTGHSQLLRMCRLCFIKKIANCLDVEKWVDFDLTKANICAPVLIKINAKNRVEKKSTFSSPYTVKKLREIPMWTTVARTKRRGGRKIPTPRSFDSAPPLSTSEFGAFRHGFFYSVLAWKWPTLASGHWIDSSCYQSLKTTVCLSFLTLPAMIAFNCVPVRTVLHGIPYCVFQTSTTATSLELSDLSEEKIYVFFSCFCIKSTSPRAIGWQ
jgi:hypothetical protein